GENALSVTLVNTHRSGESISLMWDITSPSGKHSQYRSLYHPVPGGGRTRVKIPYSLTETCPKAYTEYRGVLTLTAGVGSSIVLGSTPVWFTTWATPIDLRLGALYLQPEQKQFVRMNFGLSSASMAKLSSVRLEVVRRGTGQV